MYRSCRYQHQTKAGIAEKRAAGHLGYMGNVPDLACEIGELELELIKSSQDLLPGVHRAVRGRAVLPG